MNALGQRTDVSQTGTAFAAVRSIAWGYDTLGQVTSADSSVNADDRSYQYDTIGNRLQSGAGVSPAAITNYTANALNQYSSITNPQSTILNPIHDADGNAMAYPLPANPTVNSTLAWDAENRLIETTVGTSGPLVRDYYDAQSRRIAETVGGNTTLFIYDAWNCIAEYSRSVGVSPTLQKTRLWGLDLSGSMQGAGGVGGLLCESQISNSQISNFFPTFDGNGNVSEYIDNVGAVTAHFEYDPFGRTVVDTDSSGLFAHRFSTKPIDSETGLYYYGYRYYDPNTGRWPSRDPIEEDGGVNLYGFVGNNSINLVDHLGNISVKPTLPPPPANSDCGKFTIDWKISMENKLSGRGYSVSKISFKWNVTECDGKTEVPSPFRDFFEAWGPIDKGKGLPPFAEADGTFVDRWDQDKKFPRTCGSLTITGDLRFYSEVRTGKIVNYPSPWTGPGSPNHPPSRDLPSMYQEPTYYGNAVLDNEKTQKMSLKISWNCCKDDINDYTTTLGSPSY